MARAVSEMTNATQAMKMNITFCSSPMPKSEKVSGMSAATGMLRPNSVSGRKKALIRGKQPQSTPSGTPTRAASPNPSATRRRVVSRLRVKARSNHRLWKARERLRTGSTGPSTAG